MRRLTTFATTLERGFDALGLDDRRLVVAVSGGADSLALLYAAAELVPARLLTAATVDHGARPGSADEAMAVHSHAQRLGVAHRTLIAHVPPGPSFEARAREARYAALEAVRRELAAEFVLTAHTANDQAETVLMRLLRGSSLRGARGILARTETLARPMLQVTRAEVEAYLKAKNLEPARDPMNEDEQFFRVAVRRRLLPLIAALAPGAIRRLAAFAQFAADDELYLQQAAVDAGRRLRVDGGWDAVGIWSLAPPIRRRLLAGLCEAHGAEVDRDVILSLEQAIERGASSELTRGVMLHAQGGLVRIVSETADATTAAQETTLALGETVVDPRSRMQFTLLHARPEGPVLDFAALSAETPLPLCVRSRRVGDRLIDGTKLQDLLVDARIPREQRDWLPVVTDAAGRIVWVPGVWPKRQTTGQGSLYVISDAL